MSAWQQHPVTSELSPCSHINTS